jgi:hypothetical protein
LSSSLPPSGPPSDPTGGPEYLEQGSGAPIAPAPASRNVRPVIIGGAAVASIAVAGGAAWAAMSFFATGAQPSEALPASTLAYASIDLDPNGAQKIEAVRTLNKFPAFKEHLDLDAEDDLRKALFDEIQSGEACPDLDYGNDIEPWLGSRGAFAAVDTGADSPSPALVVQVTDADAAEAGLAKIRDCGVDVDVEGGAEAGGWSISGDWAVIAETAEIAERISTAASESTLADDAEFQLWTARAGDPGIVSVYAAPEAGAVIFDSFDGMMPMAGLDASPEGSDDAPTEEMRKAFEDFEGMAATIRFDDGALELETAGGIGLQTTTFYGTDGGDDVMSTLPADTVAAFGMGFEDGWLTQLVDELAKATGEETSAEEMWAELSAETGLDLPADAETLAGESAAVAMGSDFDAEKFFNSADGSDTPVGVKVKGDPAAIDAVLEKLRGQLGPDETSYLDSDADGEMIAVGPNADYRAALLEDGGLGASDTFRDVIREAERAGVILYVDFDGSDDWLTGVVGEDPTVSENLAPLSALGVSAWQEDGVPHGVLRITTD